MTRPKEVDHIEELFLLRRVVLCGATDEPIGGIACDDLETRSDLLPLAALGDAGSAREARLRGSLEC